MQYQGDLVWNNENSINLMHLLLLTMESSVVVVVILFVYGVVVIAVLLLLLLYYYHTLNWSTLQDTFQMCKEDASEHMENISRPLITPASVKIKVNIFATLKCGTCTCKPLA